MKIKKLLTVLLICSSTQAYAYDAVGCYTIERIFNVQDKNLKQNLEKLTRETGTLCVKNEGDTPSWSSDYLITLKLLRFRGSHLVSESTAIWPTKVTHMANTSDRVLDRYGPAIANNMTTVSFNTKSNYWEILELKEGMDEHQEGIVYIHNREFAYKRLE